MAQPAGSRISNIALREFPLESKDRAVTNSALVNFLVLIPVLAYVALHFVKIRPAPGGLWPAIAVWAAMFAGAAIVLSHPPATLFYPKNGALQEMQSELYRLADKPLKKGDVVLVIQGSSAVSACVKGRVLERLLRDRKLPVRVFLLSVPGSNHFERLELLREWLAELPPAQAAAFRAAHVVLLSEILYVYDLNPLSGFLENAFGDRSIAYTTPANVVAMLETAWQTSRAKDFEDRAPASLMPVIAEHYLFNVFRVGTISTVETATASYSNHGAAPAPRPSKNAASPPKPPSRPEGFDYASAVRDFRAQMAEGKGAKALRDFPWQSIHEQERFRIASGYVDAFGYLATPHIVTIPRKYEQRILGEFGGGAIRFDGGDDAVLALLDKAEYWRDQVHLTPAGAEIFTRWLADEIAAAWPQISGKTSSSLPDKSH